MIYTEYVFVTKLLQSFRIAAGTALLLSLCFCGNESASGPGGTDFPNTRTVAGIIVHENGAAASAARVELLSSMYDPGTNDQSPVAVCSTDAAGLFSMSIPDSGAFTITAVTPSSGTRLLITGVGTQACSDDTMQLDTAVLRKPGALVVKIPDSLRGSTGRFYLPGTDVFAVVDSGDAAVTLDSVPAGTVPPLCFTREADGHAAVRLGDSITVGAESTVVIAPDCGDTALILTVNTLDSGISISQTVTDFPLAIAVSRLPVAFRNAAAEGRRMTVTDDRFRILPLEREAGTDSPVLWVLMDTIRPDDREQVVYLFLNGSGTADAQNADPVFDTANGFAAVWHFDGGCIDATVNRHDGTREGSVGDVNGVLGGAKSFHGSEQISVPGLLGKPQNVTLSAWARLDTAVVRGAEVVSIGDAVLIRMDDTWREKGCHGAYCTDPDAADTATHEFLGSGSYLAGTGWHYFTYVVDAAAMRHRWYIDGEIVDEETMPVAVHYDNLGSDVIIGNHGNGKTEWNFIGSIDEVRVEHCVRSASWIRLCYLDQQPGGRLVQVKE